MASLPGVVFRLDGERLVADSSRPLTNDDRKFIRDHKGELVVEIERRRRRAELLMLLAENPGIKYAYVVDAGTDPVVVAIGIRGVATFEMKVRADRYDCFKLLAFVEGQRGEGSMSLKDVEPTGLRPPRYDEPTSRSTGRG